MIEMIMEVGSLTLFFPLFSLLLYILNQIPMIGKFGSYGTAFFQVALIFLPNFLLFLWLVYLSNCHPRPAKDRYCGFGLLD